MPWPPTLNLLEDDFNVWHLPDGHGEYKWLPTRYSFLNVKLDTEHTSSKALFPLGSELLLETEVKTFQSLLNKLPKPTAFPISSCSGSLQWRCLSLRVGSQAGIAGERRNSASLTSKFLSPGTALAGPLPEIFANCCLLSD